MILKHKSKLEFLHITNIKGSRKNRTQLFFPLITQTFFILCHGILKNDFFPHMTNTEVVKCGFIYLKLQNSPSTLAYFDSIN